MVIQLKNSIFRNQSVKDGRDGALRRPDAAARRPYRSQPAVTDRLRSFLSPARESIVVRRKADAGLFKNGLAPGDWHAMKNPFTSNHALVW
jgi:hypothetical protein